MCLTCLDHTWYQSHRFWERWSIRCSTDDNWRKSKKKQTILWLTKCPVNIDRQPEFISHDCTSLSSLKSREKSKLISNNCGGDLLPVKREASEAAHGLMVNSISLRSCWHLTVSLRQKALIQTGAVRCSKSRNKKN